ncbi:hypothetical protein [Acinetobacter sp.]|uniref:hypothetical protein n=1 Tax=Acinetobacter sp. TaxID=472 RepID=UPI00338E6270
MMSLEQKTELYAAVLRQLLPVGGYDRSPNTNVGKDIYAHAKAFAQVEIDARRLLNDVSAVPIELLAEYENEYGLPLKCSSNIGQSTQQRLDILNWVMKNDDVFSREYLITLFGFFGVTVLDVLKHRPITCIQSCKSPVNTEQLRFKVTLKLQKPVNADVQCIIENYFPAFLRIDIVEV